MEKLKQTERTASNIKILTVNDLLNLNIYKRGIHHPRESYRLYKKKDDMSFSIKYVKSIIHQFNDALLYELIINNGIFAFPWKLAYMFVAEMKTTRRNEIIVAFVSDYNKYWDRNNSAFIILLNNHWKSVLDEEIENGHRYENFDLILKKLGQSWQTK